MCKILKVSRNSYYKYLNKKESRRSIENKYLEGEILDTYKACKIRYEAPKIHKNLNSKDIFISLKKTQRLMNKLGIKSVHSFLSYITPQE